MDDFPLNNDTLMDGILSFNEYTTEMQGNQGDDDYDDLLWFSRSLYNDNDANSSSYSNTTDWGNSSSTATDYSKNSTDSDLLPAVDISIYGVLTSLEYNSFAFVTMIISYEVLRRYFPSVYAGRQRHVPKRMVSELSPSYNPMNWVIAVARIPWARVRESGGLDAYMFLRYILMCFRITMIGAFWGIFLLWPIFASGGAGAKGWYHVSMANLEQSNWRIWIPAIFMWSFSFFVYYAMDKEFQHYVDLRMVFLGKGERGVKLQHHYSIMVEKIPYELRSDKALFDYFDSLFPGKIYSACVVLNLPELEALAARRQRVRRRLEKAVAFLESSGKRPTHISGRPRWMLFGIESEPLSFLQCKRNAHKGPEEPKKGDRVDSIIYYAKELAEMNVQVRRVQVRKNAVAETGNQSVKAQNWMSRVVDAAHHVAGFIGIDEGCGDGDKDENEDASTAKYGSLEEKVPEIKENVVNTKKKSVSIKTSPLHQSIFVDSSNDESWDGTSSQSQSSKSEPYFYQGSSSSRRSSSRRHKRKKSNGLLFPDETDKAQTPWESWSENLGFDCMEDTCLHINQGIDVYVDSVVGMTMSATGFVTFIDLASVTCAASAPLTHKPEVLKISLAPEPRDIIWKNAHIDSKISEQKTSISNVLLGFGVLFWSIPLTMIQAFATADQLARFPGMQWILTFDGGRLTSFINGYLPVVALLCLILLLPIIFELIAVNYENRKLLSDIQHSILTRYFYYQLANIYITVTAGSLWDSLADIIDHPQNILKILGKSLPTVVGYFVSLLLTKILAGLPMILLRGGALARAFFYRCCFNEKNLTQRELDEIYRPHYLLYGWEYPTQLLVIIICFTYVCISPIIMPVGALYFLGALLVYKKQVLYVYTPAYETGGSMFPVVCQRTLMGLMCAQLVFVGYISIRQALHQFFVLLPLPFTTLWMMSYFRKTYVTNNESLSLERAMDIDRQNYTKPDEIPSYPRPVSFFDEHAYRQPVLTEPKAEPRPYRKAWKDAVSQEVFDILNNGENTYLNMASSDNDQKVPSHEDSGNEFC